MNPLDHLASCVAGMLSLLEKVIPSQAVRTALDLDFDRAADRLSDREAETEVLEPQMTWLGWAVPAILEVLSEHEPRPFIANAVHNNEQSIFRDYDAWINRIAPIIAARIGCDPQRAAEALLRYNP